jgi:hypothetical protein
LRENRRILLTQRSGKLRRIYLATTVRATDPADAKDFCDETLRFLLDDRDDGGLALR